MKNLVKLFVVTGLLINSAHAKRFASQFCSFELPSGWECALEGTEWVCQSENAERKKESIIILAAKLRGKADSLSQYQAYLKKTKTFKLPGGKTQVSEPKYTDKIEVNEHQWIDALHMASEVPGFFTRYLATVKEDLGVAVTFSVAKDFYPAYKPIFDKVVQSLRVFRQKSKTGTYVPVKSKDENLLGGDIIVPDQTGTMNIGQKSSKGGGMFGMGDNDYILAIIALAVIGFIISKKKKKK